MLSLLLRMLPESALLKLGRWDECEGLPTNAWAEEFDRRDRAALARKEGE